MTLGKLKSGDTVYIENAAGEKFYALVLIPRMRTQANDGVYAQIDPLPGPGSTSTRVHVTSRDVKGHWRRSPKSKDHTQAKKES